MTILFHPNIRNLMIGKGILAGGLTADSGITIYSGIQPSAADILANWTSYNSANAAYLAHYSSANWTQPLDGAATFCSITKFPTAVNASHTGVGTWCIIWSSNPTALQLAAATIPFASFIVGPVSTLTGNGIVRFNPDTNFVLGSSKAIADGVISASSN